MIWHRLFEFIPKEGKHDDISLKNHKSSNDLVKLEAWDALEATFSSYLYIGIRHEAG